MPVHEDSLETLRPVNIFFSDPVKLIAFAVDYEGKASEAAEQGYSPWERFYNQEAATAIELSSILSNVKQIGSSTLELTKRQRRILGEVRNTYSTKQEEVPQTAKNKLKGIAARILSNLVLTS